MPQIPNHNVTLYGSANVRRGSFASILPSLDHVRLGQDRKYRATLPALLGVIAAKARRRRYRPALFSNLDTGDYSRQPVSKPE